MKIVIADDNEISRLVLSVLLRQWGHEVVIARGGVEAQAHLLDGADLGLLDMEMADLDGLSVCRKLRERRSTGGPYVVLLTPIGAKVDIRSGLHAGADDFLTKPCDPRELLACLDVAAHCLHPLTVHRAVDRRLREETLR